MPPSSNDELCEAREPQCNRPIEALNPKNSIRGIGIEQLNYGYLVKVGCNTFAIETAEKLIGKLAAYIKNPAETEKKWFDGDLFK